VISIFLAPAGIHQNLRFIDPQVAIWGINRFRDGDCGPRGGHIRSSGHIPYSGRRPYRCLAV
jgi:hypothetical protein